MKSQNATATIGNETACAGDTLLVPVHVTDFFDVGAMTFYIGYDTNTAEFLSLQNVNPVIAGWLNYNANNNEIGIAYSSLTPFTIASDKIFDLRFRFLGDSTILPFNEGTEIANSDLEIIPLDTYTGSIATSINLVNQPDSVQAYPDNDVLFRVTSLGTPNFQWQENSGSGWVSLQNNQTYSGVTDDTLYISDVTLSFNLNEYRCILTAGNCTVISGTGLLEVANAFPAATLGQVSSCPEEQVMEPLFAGDFIDVIEFTFNISFDTSELTFIAVTNIHPDLASGTFIFTPMTNPAGISVNWEQANSISISSGKLFDLVFDYGYQDHVLAFEPGTIVLNSTSNPVNITLTNGSVNQDDVPEIITQPVNDTVINGQQALFHVEANGVVNYLWQISTDQGASWNPIAEIPPYYNTTSETLTITPAVLSMNGDMFACILESENCQALSESALLVVDTLSLVNQLPGFDQVNLFPNPFREVLYVDVTNNTNIQEVRMFTPEGKLVLSYGLHVKKGSLTSIKLNTSDLPPGLYFLNLEGSRNDGFYKVIKTD